MDPIRAFWLAAVVLLSLVLPLAAGAWSRSIGDGRIAGLRTVWVGQLLEAAAGLWIVVAPVRPEFGVVAAFVTCLMCLRVLRRPMQPA